MRRIAIVGLGRFGMAVARHLGDTSVQVIAIDNDRQLIGEIRDHVDLAICMDSTDERALVSQDIGKVDVLVVAIGENFEAALLTAVIARRLGVPKIVCRARTPFHAEIFRQIGADEVIEPETDTGHHLARRLANPYLEDFIQLGEGFTLIELIAPREFRGRSIRELQLRAKYGVNLVAIKRSQQQIVSVPQPDAIIEANDVLVVIGSDQALAKLPKE